MYNKDFITTYKDIHDNDLTISLYQSQLIQAFNLQKFDEIAIGKNINIIEQQLSNNSNIITIKKKLLSKYGNILLNEDNIFALLFSYDYFDNFHKCYIKDDFSNFII